MRGDPTRYTRSLFALCNLFSIQQQYLFDKAASTYTGRSDGALWAGFYDSFHFKLLILNIDLNYSTPENCQHHITTHKWDIVTGVSWK